ncbi:MAG: ABC transporter substrate-binding protein, partial [Ramlibacter sp.]
MKSVLSALGAALFFSLAGTSHAAESVSLMLNWTPTADHSPIYYAKSKGWYADAGIDLSIESGKGSAVSAQRVGSGGSSMGISD